MFEVFQVLFPTVSLSFEAAKLFLQVTWERTKQKALTASYL